MFLFSTPAATPPQALAASPVIDAIRKGAEQTGTDFGYLLATARRESALNPSAKAPTSSATGLFQFIEQTWLGLVKSEGAKLGLGDLAGAISARSDGTFGVGDPGARQTILKLREDPTLSSLMAGTLTQQNRESLAAATGREPNAGELYMAHLLGARGAGDLIRSANDNPSRPVALDMPDAASANRTIFYDRRGKPREAAELYAMLSATPAAANVNGTAAATPSPPVQQTPFRPVGPVTHGLFQTDGRTGPISEAVAKLWRVNRATVDPKATALSYFPRLDGSASLPEPEPAREPATAAPAAVAEPTAPALSAGTPADVPLPPPRPRSAVHVQLRPS